MIRRSSLLLAARNPIAFRSTAETNNGASAMNKPAGAAAGDLVVVVSNPGSYTLATFNGDAWDRNQVGTVALLWKILNATDVANAWNFSGGGFYCAAAAYSPNGEAIRSATVRRTASTASPSDVSLALTGYSGERPRGMISAITDDSTPSSAPVAPSGFAARISRTAFGQAIADDLNNYGGGDVAWTGLYSGGGDSHAWLLEVL